MGKIKFDKIEYCHLTYIRSSEMIFHSAIYAHSGPGSVDHVQTVMRVIWKTLTHLNGCPDKPFPAAWFRKLPKFAFANPKPLDWHCVSKNFLAAARDADVQHSIEHLTETRARELVDSLVWSDPSLRQALLSGYGVTACYGGGQTNRRPELIVAYEIGGKANAVATSSEITLLALLAITTHWGLGRRWGDHRDEYADIQVQEIPCVGSATLRAAASVRAKTKSGPIIKYLEDYGHTKLANQIKYQSDIT